MRSISAFGTAGSCETKAVDSYRGGTRDGAFRHVNLTDDLFFGFCMNNKEFCKQILSIILDEKVVDVQYNTIQKTLQNLPGYKSIRLDAFITLSDGKICNVEMQKLNNDSMPKRARYYQGLMDVSSLLSGKNVSYDNLPESVVIFITDFDVFGLGRYRYTFKNACLENTALALGDGTTKIFLNLRGTNKNSATQEQIELLQYILSTTVENETDSLTEIAHWVETLRASGKWEDTYMNYKAYAQDEIKAATEAAVKVAAEKAKTEGRAEGMTDGAILQLVRLVSMKLNKGKSVDQIANELEQRTEVINSICDVLNKHSLANEEELLVALRTCRL